MSTVATMTMNERVRAVLDGRKPDRIPFVDRLELWYISMQRQNAMPAEFEGMSLQEIHAALHFGQLKMLYANGFRLRGVELLTKLDGEPAGSEMDPVTTRFPTLLEHVDGSRIGTTEFELRTPVGSLHVREELLPEAYRWGEIPYFAQPPIKDRDDFKVMNWILDRVEIVPWLDEIRAGEEEVGDNGFVLPLLPRIPFQNVMIDCVGEMEFFYMLADDPDPLVDLMGRMHELNLELIRLLADWDYPYVEFADNLTGVMANPKLFAQYCAPHYEEYRELLHAQGKKMGSHVDGDLKSLLRPLREVGLDVGESFSPAPLTECTFDEAWEAWRDGGPIMWGVIPSPLLEERVPEAEFQAFVEHVLDTVGSEPIILGISDMVLGNNLVDRVKWLGDRIEGHVLD